MCNELHSCVVCFTCEVFTHKLLLCKCFRRKVLPKLNQAVAKRRRQLTRFQCNQSGTALVLQSTRGTCPFGPQSGCRQQSIWLAVRDVIPGGWEFGHWKSNRVTIAQQARARGAISLFHLFTWSFESSGAVLLKVRVVRTVTVRITYHTSYMMK